MSPSYGPYIQGFILLIDPAEIFKGLILIIAPHMDDEILACGGTIAMLPNKGKIHVIYATDGMKSPSPIVPWRDSITPDLGQVRIDESISAMRSLGVPEANTHFLRLPEADLRRNGPELKEQIRSLISTLKPDTILVPFRYDRHPDHLMINHVVGEIFEDGICPKANIFEYFVYYRWRLLPKKDVRKYILPNYMLEVDIAEVAPIKRAALDYFKSQTTIYYPWQTRPILTKNLLDEECQQTEQFLRFDPAIAGKDVFRGNTYWIRIAHRLEPFLQKKKYQVSAFMRRELGKNTRDTV
jgi:LmbE family N-acetylglucosaminyl deacetylase